MRAARLSAALEGKRYPLALAGVALAYFAVAKLALSFAADDDLLAAVWAPSGVALAAVVVLGCRIWPAIAVGALVANATGEATIATAAGIATGNTLAALAAGLMLSRLGFDPSLRRIRDVAALAITGAAIAGALSASVGVGTQWAGGIVEAGGLWSSWRVWWLGDLTGVLLVAPLLFVLVRPPGLRRATPARAAEASVLGLAIVAVTLLVLREGIALAYPIFPPIVVAAMRFRQPGAVIAVPLVAAFTVACTGAELGPFAGGAPADELLAVQVFVALVAMTGLVVAAMRSEWQEAERARDRLAESESAFASAQRLAHIGSWEWDLVANRVTWSEELHRILGVDPEGLAPSYEAYLELVHYGDRERLEAAVKRAFEHDEPLALEHRILRPAGELRIVACHGRIVRDAAGRALKIVGTAQDVTEQRAAQERFRDLLEAAPDPLVILNEAGEIELVNSQTEAMFGYRREELIGSSIEVLILDPESAKEPASPKLFELGEGELAVPGGDLTALRKDGTKIPVEVNFNPLRTAGRVLTVGAIRDIAERRLAEQQLEREALHDPLTGLPNRTLFLDRLEHALIRARRPQSSLAVYFCDIDNFKRINDSLGHDVGDEVLRALPARLATALRQADTLARFGGDEFVILCEDLASEEDAIRIAERITEGVADPFELNGREHELSVSVGVVFVEGGRAIASEVLRDADLAMYRAKGRGKGRFDLFDTDMRQRVVERLEIEADLRRAVGAGELRLLYQPVLSLETAEFVAAEALLRWEHPERGRLSPADFIDVAEDSGLIVPIGAWVIGEALRQAAEWATTRPTDRPLGVSVNLSPRQVSDPGTVAVIEAALAESGLDPYLVELEITEKALVDDARAALVTLMRLKELGIELVLDDFGTGHSSLSRLKRFPIDVLKVDREFISGLGEDGEDTAIVSAVLSMAWALDIEVVAEGVETAAQLEWLAEHGCRFAQGFLLSGLVDAAQVARIGAWKPGPVSDEDPPPPAEAPVGDPA